MSSLYFYSPKEEFGSELSNQENRTKNYLPKLRLDELPSVLTITYLKKQMAHFVPHSSKMRSQVELSSLTVSSSLTQRVQFMLLEEVPDQRGRIYVLRRPAKPPFS